MQLHFTGKNLELTSSLKDAATVKLQSLEKRNHNITHVYVVFQVERGMQRAEANVHFNGHEIHASAEDHDMYIAVDALVTKLETQLTKHREKLIDNHR
jgi:putative sigma-54 modulation protein